MLWAISASTVTLGALTTGRWQEPHPRGGEWLWVPHSTQGDIPDEILKNHSQGLFFRGFGSSFGSAAVLKRELSFSKNLTLSM